MNTEPIYSGPFTRLFVVGNRAKPQRVIHGFVELRQASDRPIIVLGAGDIVGAESLISPGHYAYSGFAAGSCIVENLEILNPAQCLKAVSQSIVAVHRWLEILSADAVEQRVLLVLRALIRQNKSVRITVSDLGRLCRLSRIWTAKVLSQLVANGSIGRDKDRIFLRTG